MADPEYPAVKSELQAASQLSTILETSMPVTTRTSRLKALLLRKKQLECRLYLNFAAAVQSCMP